MAGYGNRTAPDYTADMLTDEHASTRLSVVDSHTTPTYGAGLGNKRASMSSSPPDEPSKDDAAEDLRFTTQSTHGSAPYTNAHTYGSACTAGAGWGNKTGSFSSAHDDAGGEGGGSDPKAPSKLGLMKKKVSSVLHSN